MKCEVCEYEWEPRVTSPKACPRCKRRFDYKYARYVKLILNEKSGVTQ